MSDSKTEKDSAVMSRIKGKFADANTIIHTHSLKGDDTVVVKASDILDVMEFLKSDSLLDFELILDLTVVDYMNDPNLFPYLKDEGARFEVVYHLYSLNKNHRVRIKAPLTEDDCQINSVTSTWIGADWFEREAWDLYGVVFRGHPDLRRILLYDGFEGHPLRKDYEKTKRQPLIGPRN